MHLGIAIFATDTSIDPGRLAGAVEERGFESLFLTEHTHMPVDHRPHPSGQGLPEEYRRTLDPFVALMAAAAETSELKLGTGICLVAQRDPILLAKETATLDHLSGGRFLFGVGYGWNRPEIEHHGVAFAQRRDVLREKVLAVRELWTRQEASFEGEHVSIAPSWSWPEPIQDPHPPILLGAAAGTTAFEHVVEFCDAWLPIGARPVFDELPRLRQVADDAGRDPDSIGVTVYGTRPDRQRLIDLAEAGVERTVLWVPSAGEDEVLERLDRYTALLEELP